MAMTNRDLVADREDFLKRKKSITLFSQIMGGVDRFAWMIIPYDSTRMTN